jgi:hypothetical protein
VTRRRKGCRLRPIAPKETRPVADRPVVTEHALLRYLERVCGVDLKAITADMLGQGRGGIIHLMESGKVPLADGFHLVVHARRVVTVVQD